MNIITITNGKQYAVEPELFHKVAASKHPSTSFSIMRGKARQGEIILNRDELNQCLVATNSCERELELPTRAEDLAEVNHRFGFSSFYCDSDEERHINPAAISFNAARALADPRSAIDIVVPDSQACQIDITLGEVPFSLSTKFLGRGYIRNPVDIPTIFPGWDEMNLIQGADQVEVKPPHNHTPAPKITIVHNEGYGRTKIIVPAEHLEQPAKVIIPIKLPPAGAPRKIQMESTVKDNDVLDFSAIGFMPIQLPEVKPYHKVLFTPAPDNPHALRAHVEWLLFNQEEKLTIIGLQKGELVNLELTLHRRNANHQERRSDQIERNFAQLDGNTVEVLRQPNKLILPTNGQAKKYWVLEGWGLTIPTTNLTGFVQPYDADSNEKFKIQVVGPRLLFVSTNTCVPSEGSLFLKGIERNDYQRIHQPVLVEIPYEIK